MDAPSTFFFGLEKETREQKYFHKLNLPQGDVTTDQREIRTHALSFNKDLYCAEQQRTNFCVIRRRSAHP